MIIRFVFLKDHSGCSEENGLAGMGWIQYPSQTATAETQVEADGSTDRGGGRGRGDGEVQIDLKDIEDEINGI